MATKTETLRAESAAFLARYNAAHWSDRYAHFVILRDGTIVREDPEKEDDNGDMVPAQRRPARIPGEAGAPGLDLGQEYHLLCSIEEILVARKDLIVGLGR